MPYALSLLAVTICWMPGRATGRFEHAGRAHDVARPRGGRVLVGHADLGLGGEVEQRPHLVLAEHPLDQELVLDGAAHDRDAVAPVGDRRRRDARRARDHDVGAQVDELLREVRAQEAGRARDGDAPVPPEVGGRAARTRRQPRAPSPLVLVMGGASVRVADAELP